MERPKTYYGFLNTIIGNVDAIENEKIRLDGLITDIGESIRRKLTPRTVPGLLWYLALKELNRILPLVGIPLSDFAGHARYLRALCAAVRFESFEPRDDPNAEELLDYCNTLWHSMFHREMIDDLKLHDSADIDRRRNNMAAMSSLLGAVQGELSYIEQVQKRIERLFTPFSAEIIEPSLGISTADIIKGFNVVRRTIPRRLENAANLMQPVREFGEQWRRRSHSGESDEETHRFVFDHSQREFLGNQIASSVREMNHILLFHPDDFRGELAERAAAFLNAFSFVPGEVNLELRTPYDDDIVRRRPFAKIGEEQFVLVDVAYSSFSPPHRLLECFDTGRKLQRLNKKRDETLEDEAAELFDTVIQAQASLRSYFLPVGNGGDLAERDLLLIKGDCVFVIESKARPLRSVARRNDKLARIATDVKESIQSGYDQACSVIRHIKSINGPMTVFDSDGHSSASLDVAGIKKFFPIVFLDSYFGFIATDLQPWLGLDEEVGFPWVVDHNTLESIILKIDSFEKMTSFLEWRRNLHGVALNEDEAVFAGFFLRHGPFEMPHGAKVVQLQADYADIFEAEYFRRQGLDVKVPPEKVGPPVFSSVERAGDEITFKIRDRVTDVVNIMTGESYGAVRQKTRSRKDGKVGRNDLCPCGSGKKFKKCCISRYQAGGEDITTIAVRYKQFQNF